ncbi:uncharacterized protein DUF4085 [Anaerobacterium chartisolvens]|uniref:Uncharacterized protein DUF4085 n=1 Tax=Anaerobacterium chartisolvens TaxID=1297424 RepID=A0A369B6G5_9FIRM|nr:DUF4085 family protein [Anaerobacterium chartisolvens]RCX16925.1 uncharacterized protein DUF4085 [Anaerobacterium chartisolvens]
MKYYTREMYEKDQVMDWLLMDKTIFSDLERYYVENGIDFNVKHEETNKLLLKYLPEHLRDKIYSIKDAIYLDKYDALFRPYLVDELEKWKNDIKQECISNSQAYSKYLNSIAMLLPDGVQTLIKTSLHDAQLIEINKPTENTIAFELDGSNCCPPQGRYIMLFSDVNFFHMTQDILPKWWIYEEIELINEDCFRMGILFDNGECELIANNLILKTK